MDGFKRLAVRLLLAPLASLSLIVVAPPAPAASPTSYGGQVSAKTLPTTGVDLPMSPGPSAGGGSGRRVH
jgi:hypothetical protein